MALVVNSVLSNVLLLEFKLSMRGDSSVNDELSIDIFSAPRNLLSLDLERCEFHFLMRAILDVVSSPFTFLVEIEVAVHALNVPLAADGLSLLFPLVVDLMSTLVLLDELDRVILGVEAHEFELADLVLAPALDLVALDLELLKSHLVLFAILLVPALPDAHLNCNLFRLYSGKISHTQ